MMNSIISEKILSASIIEADFNDAARSIGVAEGEIGQPVINIHAVAATSATTSIAFTS
jgi:hypothetical protein